MLDSNTTQWGRCSHHWSMSVVVTRTLIEISVHINEWDGSTTRKMCVQTPSLVTWVTCWLNWVIIPSIFWCHSQCINYRQEKLLSLIYIINISSITLLRLENQQNNTSSPNLSCSSVSLMQRHSVDISSDQHDITECRIGKGWAVPLPHAPLVIQ